MMRLELNLVGLARCPHCNIAHPQLVRLWQSDSLVLGGVSGQPGAKWAAYNCTSCGGVVLAKGEANDQVSNPPVERTFPETLTVHEDVPQPARRYLEQAYETIHAPDAAAVMAGSAVDAMLKSRDYKEGGLYPRIKKAVGDHLLTKEMGQWAHSVRLESNKPRHADDDEPHVTAEQAEQSIEFADALAQFLFVLPARIEKGIEQAESEVAPST